MPEAGVPKPIVNFQFKLDDLVARSVALPLENADTADVADAEAVDAAADSVFTYGAVDMRGQQPGEVVASVPQGAGSVRIYFNPSTREARPIPKNPL